MKVQIIKLGGSILYDDSLNINMKFLRKVVTWFEENKDTAVVFVVGGGKLSRFLVSQVNDEIVAQKAKHGLGIKVTSVNAWMVAHMFNDSNVGYFDSIKSVCNAIRNNNMRGAVIGGVVEGWSTDMVGANIAKELGTQMITKISNIDYIYSCDPKVDKEAQAFKDLSWDEYIKIFNNNIGNKHEPGMNAPVDIVCSKFCKENDIAFRVTGGDLEKEFEEILGAGTLVS